jgi:two-component system sensor histidine kinase KdpD
VTGVLGVLVYDYLFTDPRHTLTVSDPGEWLNLLLLLFVAVTVGQLAALQRLRTRTAIARDAESRTLFEVTRALATRTSTIEALPTIADAMARATGMSAVWISLGGDEAGERVVAQSADRPLPRPVRSYSVLHPAAVGESHWTHIRTPPSQPRRAGPSPAMFRVRISDAERHAGSIWVQRSGADEAPDARSTALLVVIADLLSQALAHDRLDEERRRAEIARQSDAVKTALLESVSHNLRTPLAAIRASAGTLMDPSVELTDEDARASAASIDREAQRLNRLVGNLLDLSRIEGGALKAAREIVDLDEVLFRSRAQVAARAGSRSIELDVPSGTTVLGDPVLLEEAVVNLLDNAVAHTPERTRVLASARRLDEAGVRLTIEDSGGGVPPSNLDRIFDKFYRLEARSGGRGGGSGVGLAVVRGFAEAMGGRVTARQSSLGGLAIDVDLPAAPAEGLPGEVA